MRWAFQVFEPCCDWSQSDTAASLLALMLSASPCNVSSQSSACSRRSSYERCAIHAVMWRWQAVAAAKLGIEALLGPPAEVRAAAAQPEDSLQRWGDVFSTIQVRHSRQWVPAVLQS